MKLVEIQNLSGKFITPLLFTKLSQCRGVVKAFIKSELHPNIEDGIFLVLNKEVDNYITIESYLYNKETYFDSCDLNETYKLFCFHVPLDFANDYNLFQKGKYSQCSAQYKEIVVSFWYGSKLKYKLYRNEKTYDEISIESYLEKVFSKNADLRRSIEIMCGEEEGRLKNKELCSTPEIDLETFKMEYIRDVDPTKIINWE